MNFVRSLLLLIPLSPFIFAAGPRADIVAVQTEKAQGGYRFEVSVRSDETGCGRYADWWEVLDEHGGLIYRRTLLHSHPQEQPFTRSGDAVDVAPDRILYIRAHLHPNGYSGTIYTGSVSRGFHPARHAPPFADDKLARQHPQPPACAF